MRETYSWKSLSGVLSPESIKRMAKERLDILMVSRQMAPSREKAKALIMSGIVYVNGQKEDKAGSTFLPDCNIEVKGKGLKYVSRGGLKLEKGLKEFPVVLKEATCLDIGASTGGFTDCMLQKGALKVYSVDVGYGQLDYSLRINPKVICMEKTNFRYVTREQITEPIDFAATDVSFISLKKILPPAYELLKENGLMICLIKPQFEAGREFVGKKGVVRDPKVHEAVIQEIVDFCRETGFTLLGLSYSPIKGPEGNIEYLLFLGKGYPLEQDDKAEYESPGTDISIAGIPKAVISKALISEIVNKAHNELS